MYWYSIRKLLKNTLAGNRCNSHIPFKHKGIQHKPFGNGLHLFRGQLFAGFVSLVQQLHGRSDAFPGHGFGPFQGRVDGIQDSSVSVVFQNPPQPFHRIIFALVWRIIHEMDFQDSLVGKFRHAFDKPRPKGGHARSVVQIDEQFCDPLQPQPKSVFLLP